MIAANPVPPRCCSSTTYLEQPAEYCDMAAGFVLDNSGLPGAAAAPFELAFQHAAKIGYIR